MHTTKDFKTIKRNFCLLCLFIALIFLLCGFCAGAAAEKCTAPKSENSIVTVSIESENFTPLDVPLDYELQEYIHALCNAYNISFSLVIAIIEQESSYNPYVISETGDYGLMQINYRNFEKLHDVLTISDIINPYENVRTGLYILKDLFEKYEDVGLVLMAYNMGETGAKNLWDQGIYTTPYCEKVFEIQEGLA